MVTQMRDLLEGNMRIRDHKALSYGKYKENSRLITKVCDFIELFANVNNKIVTKADQKGKEVSRIFRETTQSLVEIERLLKEIRVVTIKIFIIQQVSQRS